MPVLSHLHALFNADQCQAYIHTLQWQDRPLQCPRCQSHHIGRWGTYHYRLGCKRYWCHSCRKRNKKVAVHPCRALTLFFALFHEVRLMRKPHNPCHVKRRSWEHAEL